MYKLTEIRKYFILLYILILQSAPLKFQKENLGENLTKIGKN